jgi:hypothetical protein
VDHVGYEAASPQGSSSDKEEVERSFEFAGVFHDNNAWLTRGEDHKILSRAVRFLAELSAYL